MLSLLATPGRSVYTVSYEFEKILVGRQPFRGVEGPRGCWINGVCDKSRYPNELRDYFGSDPFDMVVIDIPTEMSSWFLYERLNAAYTPVGEIPAASRYPESATLRWRKIIFEKKKISPDGNPPARPTGTP